ncbi:MAG: ABC transporter permease [DPANN group archaeon]|nr:ABC transporter permease [DPANN group archaeon]
MLYDYVLYVLRNLRERQTRSYLTMIGIVIGIAAVVSLISMGNGLESAIMQQFEEIGTDILMIMPGSAMGSAGSMGMPGAMSTGKLTDDDIDLIESVKGVDMAGGMITKEAQVKFKGISKNTFISGFAIDESYKIIQRMSNFVIEDGRDARSTDTYHALIGTRVRHGQFFGKEVTIGSKIEINGYDLKVIGSLETLGNNMDDQNIFIPLETAKKVFNMTDDYMIIMVDVKDNFNPADVAEDIKKAMRKDRDVKEGKEDFTIQTTEELMDSLGTILNIVQVILIGLAGISLFVGGLGIMNTMYTSVIERRKDIGIMKAIGARNNDILLIFLIESSILGFTGGVLGSIVGYGIAKMAGFAAAMTVGTGILNIEFDIMLSLAVIVFSTVIGSVSGIFPARQAANLNPVESLSK